MHKDTLFLSVIRKLSYLGKHKVVFTPEHSSMPYVSFKITLWDDTDLDLMNHLDSKNHIGFHYTEWDEFIRPVDRVGECKLEDLEAFINKVLQQKNTQLQQIKSRKINDLFKKETKWVNEKSNQDC